MTGGASTAVRVSLFLAGVIAIAIGAVITIGAGLAGAMAIGVAALVLKRKGHRVTRRGAWLASVAATIGVLAIAFGILVLGSGDSATPTAAERAEQRARQKEMTPEWVKVISPNAQRQTEAADSIATALLDNKAVRLWAGLMGTAIAAGLMGTISGSFVWGGVMLMNRSFSGDWLPSTGTAAAE